MTSRRAVVAVIAAFGLGALALMPGVAVAAYSDPAWLHQRAFFVPGAACDLQPTSVASAEGNYAFRTVEYCTGGESTYGDMVSHESTWPAVTRDAWRVPLTGSEASTVIWLVEARGTLFSSEMPRYYGVAAGAGAGEEYADLSVSIVGTGTWTAEIGVDGFGGCDDTDPFLFHPPSPPLGGGSYIARNFPMSECNTVTVGENLILDSTVRYGMVALIVQSYDTTTHLYDYDVWQRASLDSANCVEYRREWDVDGVSRATSMSVSHGGGQLQTVGYDDVYCAQASESGTGTLTLTGEVRAGMYDGDDAASVAASLTGMFQGSDIGMAYLMERPGARSPSAEGSAAVLPSMFAGVESEVEPLLAWVRGLVEPFEGMLWPVTILSDGGYTWSEGD